jgi:hypothetical protein
MQRGCRALILAGMPGFVRLLCGFLNGTGARPLFLKKKFWDVNVVTLYRTWSPAPLNLAADFFFMELDPIGYRLEFAQISSASDVIHRVADVVLVCLGICTKIPAPPLGSCLHSESPAWLSAL